jgi:hypothetical protein
VPPDFFNSREDAIGLWIVLILAYVLYKDFRGIGGAFLAVLRSLVQGKLLLVFGSVLVYTVILVYAARALDLWHTDALKATIYWFLGTAVVVTGQALTDGARNTSAFLRTVLKRLVAVTLITEFIVNVYALPLFIEIVCVFILFAFAGMQALVEHDPSQPQSLRTFIEVVLAAVGFLYLGYFVFRALTDLDAFFSRQNAEDFLVGPALTVMLVPFLLFWAWFSRREQQIFQRRWRTPGKTLV